MTYYFRNYDIQKIIGIGTEIDKLQSLLPPSLLQYYYKTSDDFILHHPFTNFQKESILIKGARAFALEKIAHFLEEKQRFQDEKRKHENDEQKLILGKQGARPKLSFSLGSK